MILPANTITIHQGKKTTLYLFPVAVTKKIKLTSAKTAGHLPEQEE